ncbi:MAG: 3'-5' exonuclease [Anaerolineae bacterium]|nr:3'-5' exonuclease [Anaerolineae bacterium]
MSHYLDRFCEMLREKRYVVLDTETTGLHQGEICQIAIINHGGDVLLDTLVKPIRRIPPEASRIHGIFDDDVKSARGWGDISSEVETILRNQHVVVYNAVYDRKMMHQSAEAVGLPKVDWKTFSTWWCAMEAFAEIYGDWNDYHGSYRWQRLSTAAAYYNIPVNGAHSALGDCLMTLAVCKAMAE